MRNLHLASLLKDMYEKPQPTDGAYTKHLFWSCKACGKASVETEQIPELTEQAMLVKRLLQLIEELKFRASTLHVEGETVSFTVRFPAR